MKRTVGIGLLLETFVFIVSKLTGCYGFEKHWLPDLEWQTADNWVAGRLPETDNRVLFPLEMRHAVGIAKSSDLRLAEIDLPKEGMLALARDGKLEISDSSRATKVATWVKEGHFFWADPENWSSKSEAAPHLERVPCQSDDVVLPNSNHTFSVLLPMKKVNVRSVRLADEEKPLTRWQWDDLRDNREFLRGRFSVGYSLYGCTNCPCQDASQADYLEEVCAIERPRCGHQKCEYPLQVEGHCCDYCGGRISLPQKTSLMIIQALASDALDGYEDKLSWYVRRTWDEGVEVLVKEKGEYSEITSQSAIVNLRKIIEENGFTVLKMETAGPPLKTSRLSVVLVLLGAPFLVLVFLLFGCRFYGYSSNEILKGCTDMWMSVREGVQVDNSKSGKRFGFARFENAPEGNVEIAGRAGIAIVEEGREGDDEEEEEEEERGEKEGRSRGGRFENPLYSSKRSKPKVERKLIDADIPLALSTLKDQVGKDIGEVELDIEE